jgi:hypothetical protein
VPVDAVIIILSALPLLYEGVYKKVPTPWVPLLPFNLELLYYCYLEPPFFLFWIVTLIYGVLGSGFFFFYP